MPARGRRRSPRSGGSAIPNGGSARRCPPRQWTADSDIADDDARWGGITLAHNVASAEEVDAVIEGARASGGTITREPSKTFYGGYAGVLCDLDGHAWEIAHNPGFGLAADGSVILRTE